MSNENSKLDAERSAFETYMLGREHPVFGWISRNWFGRGDNPATYENDYVQGCWVMWQARASLPVGVPDVLFDGFSVLSALSDKAKARTSSENVSDVLDAVVKLIRDEAAAPTVKAEQVQCRTCNGSRMVDDGEITCSESGIPFENGPVKCVKDCPDCAAPSLPAAGSADQPYPDGIAEDLERSDWTPLEALQWYAAGKHFDVVGGRTRIIDTGAVASNALKHASLAYLELKGDAELSELRAALSAQQSAPERVSVPVELVEKAMLACFEAGHGITHDELRAIIASHGQGEA